MIWSSNSYYLNLRIQNFKHWCFSQPKQHACWPNLLGLYQIDSWHVLSATVKITSSKSFLKPSGYVVRRKLGHVRSLGGADSRRCLCLGVNYACQIFKLSFPCQQFLWVWSINTIIQYLYILLFFVHFAISIRSSFEIKLPFKYLLLLINCTAQPIVHKDNNH